MLINKEKTLSIAAAKSGMDEKTARKYCRSGKLPSQLKQPHNWQTRKNPFENVWPEAVDFLTNNHGLEAKTLFEYFQRKHESCFEDGQLRTFQRKVKVWKALEGPAKEVYFPQLHYPGDLCASDFTCMNNLLITINREPFKHLIYHFVLSYSNWETGTICFSESFESLSSGLQSGLWTLGGVPKRHRTDRLSAAVHKECNPEEFTTRYKGLLDHYRIKGEKINAGKSNENGDVEQSHHRFKKAVEQLLILRGSRDFNSRNDYMYFIRDLFSQLNSGRQKRFKEELKVLRQLPGLRLDDFKSVTLKVGSSSTLHIAHNVYSVHSRLIGERVNIRLYAEHIELWYGQKKIDSFPRLRGDRGHKINYRHIIDYLVRKPGAFNNYRYRDDLFPTTQFKMAYDYLCDNTPTRASREYVRILELAAKESEQSVNESLKRLFDEGKSISVENVQALLKSGISIPMSYELKIPEVDLNIYDQLMSIPLVQEASYG